MEPILEGVTLIQPFPVHGKASDPLLPSMGRTQEGCSVATPFSKECSIILRLPTENENPDFVMPAWIAGIQVCKDASGNIRVNLDSSTPCWNDATAQALLEVTEVPRRHMIFKGARRI